MSGCVTWVSNQSAPSCRRVGARAGTLLRLRHLNYPALQQAPPAGYTNRSDTTARCPSTGHASRLGSGRLGTKDHVSRRRATAIRKSHRPHTEYGQTDRLRPRRAVPEDALALSLSHSVPVGG